MCSLFEQVLCIVNRDFGNFSGSTIDHKLSVIRKYRFFSISKILKNNNKRLNEPMSFI